MRSDKLKEQVATAERRLIALRGDLARAHEYTPTVTPGGGPEGAVPAATRRAVVAEIETTIRATETEIAEARAALADPALAKAEADYVRRVVALRAERDALERRVATAVAGLLPEADALAKHAREVEALGAKVGTHPHDRLEAAMLCGQGAETVVAEVLRRVGAPGFGQGWGGLSGGLKRVADLGLAEA